MYSLSFLARCVRVMKYWCRLMASFAISPSVTSFIKHLGHHSTKIIPEIVVCPRLTCKEELQYRKDQGEKDLVIKNGTITVKKFPHKNFLWRTPVMMTGK